MNIYSEITEVRRKELQSSLADSNKILRKYYKQIAVSKGSRGFETHSGDNINRPKFYKQILELSKNNPSCDLTIHGVSIPYVEVEKITNLENIKWEIVTSISNMIYSIVNKKINKIKDRSLSFEDLESEGFKSILSSIHSYSDDQICFSTYFYTCVNREINNLCNRSNPMSKLSKKSISLKKKFAEAKKLLDHYASFDEIVSSINMNQNDIDLLRKAMNTQTLSEDSMVFSKHYCGVDGGKQYFASGSSRGNLILSCSNNNFDDSLSTEDRMGDLDLTPLEKAVLDGVMQSTSKLGINSVAKNLINPKTGKPFSRMAITYAWRRVKSKINKFKEAA